ncbi:hypothetical protein EOK75_18450 (plasmid) [Pseudorhodobacter turbinis]|uniref:DUF6538 domain-containing protein n=1 Tax=Pseudorhodobacter turbinis TaxID=2500533 RepID=A0A4P8EL32_9RHOB|nr:hypothetical protein EOK75_18450 [Pseudorhodobacter turbinis]
MTLMGRGKMLWLRKRVPVRYSCVEGRKEVWLSLHTDSETIAMQKASLIWDEQIEAWEARLAGDRTVERGSFGPVFISSTVARFRHLATV